MQIVDAQRVRRTQLRLEAKLCSSALREAGRLVAAEAFGPRLDRSLAQACDILDEMDDVLLGLHPGRDVEAFACAAALHRELEQLQSMVPREHRCARSRRLAIRQRIVSARNGVVK